MAKPKSRAEDWPYQVAVYIATSQYNPEGEGVGRLDKEDWVKIRPRDREAARKIMTDIIALANRLQSFYPQEAGDGIE